DPVISCDLFQVLTVHEKRFFRLLSSEYRWAKSQLQGFTKGINTLPRGSWAHSVGELIGYLEAREAYARNKKYKDHFGELFSGIDTDWTRLKRLLSWTEELRRTILNRQLIAVLLSRNERVIFSLGNEHARLQKSFESFAATLAEILNHLVQTSKWTTAVKAAKIPSLVEQWLFAKDSRNLAKILADFAATIQPMAKDLDETLNKLWSFGECNQKEFFGCNVQELPLVALREKLGACLTTLAGAGKWADYCRAVQHTKTLGLQEIIGLVVSGKITHNQLVVAYEYALYFSLAKTIIREHPLLRDFTRVSHDKIRAKFAELDNKILRLNRELIAYQASNKKPPEGQSSGPVKRYTEMGLIYHEISKKKRHVPIRQLIAKAGRALQVIKPCFMMGPLSVAQYLPPGDLEFDLVIMDEASQVKPEEALGAIARGKQIIIVGDPKQLPPTSFFDRLGEAEVDEDEELALDDSESILDICMQTYRPARRLCWHYRSEHESLVNFSNHQFYDKDLILFPSSVGIGYGLGIRHHYINNALYENHRNKAEAETVSRAVLAHAQRHPVLSLGVGTFNIQQKELIEDYIERMRTANPALDEFIERQSANGAPFFVKNLENIQGDERDVIFISTTYGPDSSRRVAQRFGPINTDGGWRRLNVIVTRAKKRVELFTSMHSSDVLISSSSSRGVRALRAYLEHAEKGGVIPTEVVATGKEPDSPFEESVAHVLRQAGYSVMPQIGVAGYFIDIGVCHPSRSDEYILGVECDGAMYHSALSARDRDRLRQDVLEHRGWKIYRIWSTDWFNNRETEIRRLLQRIDQCLKETGGTVQSAISEPSIGYEQSFATMSETTKIASSAELPHATKGGLTITEARQRLLDLNKNKILPEFPNHEKSILRKEMLEALLRNMPTTLQEFREFIPLRFREATDSNQMKFLAEILEILKQIFD
ncbi:MAG: AAA domain-containing protein, partial [Nitrospirota bacterium]